MIGRDMLARYLKPGLTALAVVLVLGLAGFFAASRLSNFILFAPRDLDLNVVVSQQVAPAENFPLQITLVNQGSVAHTLQQIEISRPYLKGIAILGSEPAYADESASALAGRRNWQRYSYELPLPPGQSVIITLSAQALSEGNFQGELDVCLESRRCRRVALVTRVEP